MAIAFIGRNASIHQAASGDITITPPTTQTDDIMLCAVATHDNVALSFPAGWTIIQEGDNTAGLRATVAWKRCVGAEGAFTVTHTAGDGIVGMVGVWRGCVNSGSPINASTLTPNASSSTVTANSITSSVDGCRLVFFTHDSDNGVASSYSSANLGAMTDSVNFVSTLGLDQAISMANVAQASSGASGASTASLSLGPDVNSGTNVFLEPAPTQLGGTLSLLGVG